MKVLIVRAAEDARRTAARLEAAGHRTIVAPVLEIRNLDFARPRSCFDAVIATSAHAFGRPGALAGLLDLPLFVVGARTSDAAQRAGFSRPKTVAANVEALMCDLRERMPSGAHFLYLAGRDRKPDVESSLAADCALSVVETYEARPVATLPLAAVDAIESGALDAVFHYSQRSAGVFLDLARRSGLGDSLGALRHVAISADAATPIAAAGLPVAVAAQPNEDSMIEELARIHGVADRAGNT